MFNERQLQEYQRDGHNGTGILPLNIRRLFAKGDLLRKKCYSGIKFYFTEKGEKP